MNNINKLSFLAGILAVGLLSNTKPANAIIFSFSTDDNSYAGTLEFSGTGTGLIPILNSNTRLTTYQGSQVNSFASDYGGFSFNNSPLFNVTSSSLTIVFDGGLTYAGGQELDFFAPNFIVDGPTGYADYITFTPATPVPFEFNSTEGIALGLPLFIGLRMLKKRRALKNSSREVHDLTSAR